MELINYSTLTPTVGGSFSNGWEVMKKYFFYLLLVVILIGLVDGPSYSMKFNNDDFHMTVGMIFLLIFGLAYSFLLAPVFVYSSKLIYIDAVRDKEIEFNKLLAGFQNYLNVILANLLKVALVTMGFLFLIIPGIIILCRLSFVSYLVMDEDLDPVQALERSWKLTKGIGWDIFAMGIISFFIWIAGLIVLIVGIFPAIVWTHSAFASMYQGALNRENQVPIR